MQAHKPPKAVTVEDSFKSCTSLEAAAAVLHILAPDLLYRLREEFQARLPGITCCKLYVICKAMLLLLLRSCTCK